MVDFRKVRIPAMHLAGWIIYLLLLTWLLSDFRTFCRRNRIRIVRQKYLGSRRILHVFPNLLALNGIFMLEAGK